MAEITKKARDQFLLTVEQALDRSDTGIPAEDKDHKHLNNNNDKSHNNNDKKTIATNHGQERPRYDVDYAVWPRGGRIVRPSTLWPDLGQGLPGGVGGSANNGLSKAYLTSPPYLIHQGFLARLRFGTTFVHQLLLSPPQPHLPTPTPTPSSGDNYYIIRTTPYSYKYQPTYPPLSRYYRRYALHLDRSSALADEWIMIHHRLRSKSSRNAQESRLDPEVGSERTLSDLKAPKERRRRGGGSGGNCYAFRGQEGNVTVLFHSPTLVTAIQLYHPKESFQCSGVQGVSNAPRLFHVYGWTNDPSSTSMNPLATHGNKGSGQDQDKGAGGGQDKGTRELPTLLGTFEFLNPCTMTQPQVTS